MPGKRGWSEGASTLRPVYLVAPGGTRGPGGIGRLVAATARHWRRAGLQPSLRIVDTYGPAGLVSAPFYLARALAQIAWNARRGRVALLHVHMAARGSGLRKGVVVWMATWLGVPTVLHLHGSRIDEFHRSLPPWGRQLLRRTLERADALVAVGEHWRRVLIEEIGVDARRIRTIANAVDGPAEAPSHRHAGACELVFIGTLNPLKGLPDLLEALADDTLAASSWRLRVAGGGDASEYRRRAAALGIAARVEFCGWVEEVEVQALLAHADVFVLPSRHEGLSMAMLEAMAHGCAVVTTPAGATLDAVTDGVSALVVPSGDRARLVEALRRVITDEALRSELQTQARRRFCEAYDIAAHCQRLLALYREISPALAAGSTGGAARAERGLGPSHAGSP